MSKLTFIFLISSDKLIKKAINEICLGERKLIPGEDPGPSLEGRGGGGDLPESFQWKALEYYCNFPAFPEVILC